MEKVGKGQKLSLRRTERPESMVLGKGTRQEVVPYGLEMRSIE